MSIASLLRSIVLYTGLIILLLFGGLYWLSAKDRAIDYDVSTEGLTIPEFTEQTINFQPTYDATQTLPFAAGTIIDIDNDGTEEVFLGGGIYQADAFYRFENGSFNDITSKTGWNKTTPDKTFGAIALDLDKDGDNDMLVARQSGVWLHLNDNAQFSAQKLALNLDPETVPLSVAVADINRDGLYDMYVSGYIARKFVQGETIFNMEYGGVSGLYLNTGDHQFKDITKESGMYYQHNTFQAVFIDVDEDGLEDIVVAHDTGQVRTWKNKGDLKFENMPNPTSDYFSYPMGIAVTDYKNNGSPDFFFSNVGSTTPDALVRGDLRDDQFLHKKWLMFENNGDFVFSDAADSAKLADYEFSWGAVFEDFNLDGRDDLVVSENYIGFPLHMLEMWRLDGRFMLQNKNGEFAEVGAEAGVANRGFSITPLVSDFNQDGYPDLIHVNLQGPQKVFLSNGGDQGYLKLKLPNTVDSIGAKVAVTLDDGSVQHQTFISGEGLCSDQTHILTFGLGAQKATNISVRFLDGTEATRIGRYSNQMLKL